MQDPADRHVPDWLRAPEEYEAFKQELLNALTCCEAVELRLPEWTANNAKSLLDEARRKRRATVSAVSLPSSSLCTQRFMAFEAKESDGRCTYLLAFRNEPNCYHDDILSDRSAGGSVINDKYQVNSSLCRRVATLREPLRSLPLQWRTWLREGRDRLILTGYSVAGAVAAVAAFNLLKYVYPELREQICCYTFGAPLQGGQRFASCINKDYASNFYHVMIKEDSIPRILTLTSKVAVNKPDVAGAVVEIICKGLEVAAAVALNGVAPGAGNAVAAIRGQFDFGRLEDGIKNLVRTERESRMPMPEYSFGGTLVVLDSKSTMKFLPKEFNDMFFFQENIDSLDVKEKVLTSHLLNSFSFLMDHVDKSNPAITNNSPSTSSKHDQMSGKFNQGMGLRDTSRQDRIEELVKDGVSRVAKSTTSAVRHIAASVCIGEPQVEEHEKNLRKYLLEPRFDIDTPMKVWFDNNQNIRIEVYGESMVLGIHVLYFVDGKEKLRVLCEDSRYKSPSLDDSKGSELLSQHTLSKLVFHTQGFKGVTFKEPSGCFKVLLAFGESEVITADRVEKRLFDSMDELKVALKYVEEPPSALIDLLIFLGAATAQAQCTSAFYAIQKDPQDADSIVKTTLLALSSVPQELTLLDELLVLVDVSLDSPSSTRSLPKQVFKTVTDAYHGTPRTKPQQPCCSSCDEKTAPYTFRGCYNRVINQMITKEMLSKKKLAEQLATSLKKELSVPKRMIIDFLDQQLTYKEFKHSYKFAETSNWYKRKIAYSDSVMISGVAGSNVPLLGVPLGLFSLGTYYDNNFLKKLGVGLGLTLGLVPGSISAGVVATALWLYHLTSSPWTKRPGLWADFKRHTRSANYEQKLEAATVLFERKYVHPGMACQLEYALYQHLNHLKDPYTADSLGVKGARYEATVALQIANFGLAGSKMCEIRRHLTARNTALGLIGSTRAGKSTFASRAFKVPSHSGPGHNQRTRVLRYWSILLTPSNYRKFTLLDFPGSTDHASADWCIEGELLTSVLVVFLKMDDTNKSEAHALVGRVCELRLKDKKLPVLLCITCADEELARYEKEARKLNDGTKAEDLFEENFEFYKEELLEGAATVAGDAEEHLDYIKSHMHACCFINDLDEDMARKLRKLKVRDVDWVKAWCVNELEEIGR